MDPDLTLSPDESLDMDDLNNIDDDQAYYDDSDLFNAETEGGDNDYMDDIDDDDDDSNTLVRDKVNHRVKTFKSWLKDIVDPLKRAKSKLIKAKAKHIKNMDKNERLKLKSAAKKVGTLSMLALALKMMIDHHQDKITNDNEKTLLKLYELGKKKANAKKKSGQPVDPIMLSLNHISKKDITNGLNDANSAINTAKSLVNTNYSNLGNQATAFGKSWLNNLANSFGINVSKFGQAFHNFIGMFKGI